MVEAALTVIQDCEDSVAAVDADDKVDVYRNWLADARRLDRSFRKGGRMETRALAPDRRYATPSGGERCSRHAADARSHVATT